MTLLYTLLTCTQDESTDKDVHPAMPREMMKRPTANNEEVFVMIIKFMYLYCVQSIKGYRENHCGVTGLTLLYPVLYAHFQIIFPHLILCISKSSLPNKHVDPLPYVNPLPYRWKVIGCKNEYSGHKNGGGVRIIS